MLDTVVEYITQAASSSAFIFCFCNLIIVIILVDLKIKLNFDQETEIHLSMSTNTGIHAKCEVNKNTLFPQAGEVSRAQEEVALEKTITEVNNDNSYSEEVEDEEEEEEDELRKRVEEFIEKVNKGWKAEYSSTSSLL